MTDPPLLKHVLLSLTVVLVTNGIFVGSWFGGLDPGDELWPFAGIMWAPVGALILWRRPGNGVGMTTGTTMGVAAMFNPVRRRIQSLVDRRFNRSRCDAQRVMDDIVGSLRDRVDADEVVHGWLGAVDTTMQPDCVGVWGRI